MPASSRLALCADKITAIPADEKRCEYRRYFAIFATRSNTGGDLLVLARSEAFGLCTCYFCRPAGAVALRFCLQRCPPPLCPTALCPRTPPKTNRHLNYATKPSLLFFFLQSVSQQGRICEECSFGALFFSAECPTFAPRRRNELTAQAFALSFSLLCPSRAGATTVAGRNASSRACTRSCTNW